MSYVIVTDSGANLPEEIYEQYNICVAPMSFHIDGKEYKSYEKGVKTDLKQFYNMMRNKEAITTSLIDPDAFIKVFSEIFEKTLMKASGSIKLVVIASLLRIML